MFGTTYHEQTCLLIMVYFSLSNTSDVSDSQQGQAAAATREANVTVRCRW